MTGGTFYIDENGTDTSIYFAGVINIEVVANGTDYDRTSMCVQLLVEIDLNTVYNTEVYLPAAFNPPTGPELEQIAWLLYNYDVSGISNLDAAGLQVAIWKIAEDGVYTGAKNPFTSGIVQQPTGADNNTMTQNIFAQAQTYLTDAVGQADDLAFVYYNTNTSTGAAVQMLEGPTFPTGPQGSTPECSTLVMAGAALLALRQTRRKFGTR